MKKNWTKLLALSMSFTLTGCGTASPPAAESSAAVETTVQATEAAGTEASGNGPAPVEQVWSPVDENGQTKRDDREGTGEKEL